MKKIKFKSSAFLLMLVTIISLYGCNKTVSEPVEINKNIEYITCDDYFTCSEYDLPKNISMDIACLSENGLYCTGNELNTDSELIYAEICNVNEIKDKYIIHLGGYKVMDCIQFDNDEKYMYIIYSDDYSEYIAKYDVLSKSIVCSEETGSDASLLEIDEDSLVRFSTKSNGVMNSTVYDRNLNIISEYSYKLKIEKATINKVRKIDDTSFCVMVTDDKSASVIVVDENLNEKYIISDTDYDTDDSFIFDFSIDNEGNILVFNSYGADKPFRINKISSDKFEIKDIVDISYIDAWSIVDGFGDYDFTYINYDGFYGFNIEKDVSSDILMFGDGLYNITDVGTDENGICTVKYTQSVIPEKWLMRINKEKNEKIYNIDTGIDNDEILISLISDDKNNIYFRLYDYSRNLNIISREVDDFDKLLKFDVLTEDDEIVGIDAGDKYICIISVKDSDSLGILSIYDSVSLEKISETAVEDIILKSGDVISDNDLFIDSISVSNEYVYLHNIDKMYKVSLDDFSSEIINLNSEGFCFVNCISDYQFCYYDSEGIYGFSENGNIVQFASWEKCKNLYYKNDVRLIDENSFMIFASKGNSEYEFIPALYIFQKGDDTLNERMNSRDTLTVAGIDINREYNKDWINVFYELSDSFSDDYDNPVLNIINYSDYEELKNEIIKGNIPDVIINQGNDYYDSDWFEDLSLYLKNDSDYNSDDYFMNIINASTKDGVIYQLSPLFVLCVLRGKQDVIGGTSPGSPEDFFEIINKKTSDYMFLDADTEEIFDLFIYSNLNSYIDYSKMKCDFNNESTVKLLNILKDTCNENPYNSLEVGDTEYDDFMDALTRRFTDNICTFDIDYILPSSKMEEDYNNVFEGPYSYIGIPSGTQSSPVICPIYSVGLTKNSESKEEGWNYIKYLIAGADKASGISLKKEQFFEEMNKIKGEYVNDNFINTIYSMIDGSSVLCFYDDKPHDSLYDVFLRFCNDELTAEETAIKIENVINLYLNEVS